MTPYTRLLFAESIAQDRDMQMSLLKSAISTTNQGIKRVVEDLQSEYKNNTVMLLDLQGFVMVVGEHYNILQMIYLLDKIKDSIFNDFF